SLRLSGGYKPFSLHHTHVVPNYLTQYFTITRWLACLHATRPLHAHILPTTFNSNPPRREAFLRRRTMTLCRSAYNANANANSDDSISIVDELTL
uniref:Ovule protein n=2 Tax=Mesocestoides corti TaxID=53468 RepID=A0A5K3FZ88_MESCO